MAAAQVMALVVAMPVGPRPRQPDRRSDPGVREGYAETKSNCEA
jgi:hypothetical protein